MRLKGVNYDVGVIYYWNWRPDFDPRVVHREIEIIKNDLHCNSIKIVGRSIERLRMASEDALRQGLEVWFSPAWWDRNMQQTLDYISRAAAAAETLRRRWPERVVFVAGFESSLFMQGILEG